jgi:thiopeptide-type bacteriocin biosynthesis protein
MERGLPRRIVLADADNRLPIDLDNVLSVETFVHLVKDREQATLTELFPEPDDMCARGPEGRFVHELDVPFVRSPAAPARASARNSASRSSAPATASRLRTFPPGSEWIYVKLYSGVSTADRALVDVIRPLAQTAIESGAADRWFFSRYGDPDWHLRVRFHAVPGEERRRLFAALHEAIAAAVTDRRVWRAQFDTYEREVERYGGPEGIDLAERIFHVDSDAVLALIEPGDQDVRGWAAFCGVHSLFDDLELDLDARRTTLRVLRAQLAREFHIDKNAKRQLADRFREKSSALDQLLREGAESAPPFKRAREVLRQRSTRLAPFMRELKGLHRSGRIAEPLAISAASYVHMHVNRLLRAAHRRQELVLYDHLDRFYEARAMRASAGDAPSVC